MIDTEKYKESRELMGKAYDTIGELVEQITIEKEKLKEQMTLASESANIFSKVDEEKFSEFLKKPWGMLPKKQNEWWVFAPKAFAFQIGWLDHSDESYNYFIVNKYMSWLSDIPDALKSKFKFKTALPLKVIDGVVYTGKDYQDEAWDRYKRYLTKRKGKEKIQIKRGSEFKLIAEMISDGIMPFTQQPVEKEELRPACGKIELRDYQKEAWNKFKECGAIGAYWAFSAGKSYFGAYVCDRIKGKKLVVVPSTTLVEQWEDYLKKYTQCVLGEEIIVVTYQSVHKYMKLGPFALVIFDESHRLPANTYAKCSTIKTKYRVGLCLDKHTKVITPTGKKQLSQLKIGDKVESYNLNTHKKEFKKVTNIWNTNKEKLVIKISTPKGVRKLICSPDHRIFHKGEFVKAKDLSSGKTIIVSGGQ